MKQIFKSKTMVFSVLLAVLGAVETSYPFLQSLLGPQAFGYMTLAVSVITAVLRTITTQPLGDKE